MMTELTAPLASHVIDREDSPIYDAMVAAGVEYTERDDCEDSEKGEGV